MMKSLASQEPLQYDIFEQKFRPIKGRKRVDIYTGEGSNFEVRTGACEELLLKVPDSSVHAFIVDPSYENTTFIDVANLCYDKLKPGGHLAIFCTSSILPTLLSLMLQTDFDFRDQFIWAYPGTNIKGALTEDGAFGSNVRNVYNPILVYRKKLVGSESHNWSTYRTNFLNLEDARQVYKGDHRSLINKYEDLRKGNASSAIGTDTIDDTHTKVWIPNSRGALPTNIQYCPKATKEEKTVGGRINNPHMSVKPLGILTWLVKLLTNSPNQLVVDCYCGTGSLGVACRKLNRAFLGIELDPENAEIARFRIKHAFSLDDKYFNNARPI